MKHISILVPNGQFSIVNIAGAFQILNTASDMFFQQTRKKLFEVEFVGCKKPVADSDGFYTVAPSKTLEEIKATDLIIVPAVHGDISESISINQDAIQWMVKQHQNGAQLAGFCIGAFLLAETGVLDGKYCSTHWGYAKVLQEMYPKIKVQAENIVCINDGIYTSGGAYAFTNLLVYLIERFGGRELALMIAKSFMIDIAKNDQSVFMIFNGQKDHQDELVLKVQEELEQNFNTDISVAQLAMNHALNRRTLERRFKSATGNSILEYLQRVRVEKAKHMLEQPTENVSSAMYDAGYSDPKSFRQVFKKYVGISPADYKKKYCAEAVLA